MASSVIWHGVHELEAALTKTVERVQAVSKTAVGEGAHLVEAAMKQRAGEGGRHKKGTPTPATQGSGPAVVSGTLRRSIRVSPVIPYGISGYSAKVGPTVKYGRRVELEFDYPYAKPGLEEVLPRLREVYARAWGAAIRK